LGRLRQKKINLKGESPGMGVSTKKKTQKKKKIKKHKKKKEKKKKDEYSHCFRSKVGTPGW